jgi:hypothetical protein
VKRRDLVQKIENWDAFSFDTAGNMIGTRIRAHAWHSQCPGIARIKEFLAKSILKKLS